MEGAPVSYRWLLLLVLLALELGEEMGQTLICALLEQKLYSAGGFSLAPLNEQLKGEGIRSTPLNQLQLQLQLPIIMQQVL